MTQRFDDRMAKALPAPERGNRITYDSEVPGLGLRVTAGGARAWVYNYRARGVERRLTIGPLAAWSVRAARDRAKELRRDVDMGRDPMADRHDDRAAPTMADLADHYRKVHLPRKRPGSQAGDETLLRVHILPRLGKVRVADVRHPQVAALHRAVTTTAPVAANRCVALLSKMFTLAVREGWRPDNPAKGVERNSEERRERFLSPAEIARLAAALAEHPERVSANAVRLLLLTGARRGEALQATWSEIDFETGTWVKPSHHTKAKRAHRLPLSPPALTLLAEMKSEADRDNAKRKLAEQPPIEHIFPSLDGKPLANVKRTWATLCRKAGISNARLHDLRHTYASVLASSGLSLPVIGALLGHTQVSTTQRYAHLADDFLRQAADRAGAVISGAASAEVLPFAPGRRG